MTLAPTPGVGRTIVVTPLTARVTLSTRQRTQVPGIVLAQWRGSRALGVTFESVSAHITEELSGSWATWEVNVRVAEKVTGLPDIIMVEGLDGVFRMDGDT